MLTTQTFIGSSSEGLLIADAIKSNLADVTECRIWTEGVFLPGRTFIETLEKLLDEVDYAILVATPDDPLTKRDVEHLSMRDNVLLELGLFMAKLGRTRTYLVSPIDKPIHIPSDLLGITTVTYPYPDDAADTVEALQAPCQEIKRAMAESQSELSLAMKRSLVRRLLVFTNRLQSLVVTLQSESVKSLTDRQAFDRVKAETAEKIEATANEYLDDADKLGVRSQADGLKTDIIEAVQDLPFPEEAVVSDGDMVQGALSHFLGGPSAKDQFQERFGRLVGRYEAWWQTHSSRIAKALVDLQAALVSAL